MAAAVRDALKSGVATASGSNGRLVATLATSKTDVHIPPSRRAVYDDLRDGDAVTFDIENRTLGVDLDASEIEARLSGWKERIPPFSTGVMAKYAASVTSASEGAITRAVFS